MNARDESRAHLYSIYLEPLFVKIDDSIKSCSHIGKQRI